MAMLVGIQGRDNRLRTPTPKLLTQSLLIPDPASWYQEESKEHLGSFMEV